MNKLIARLIDCGYPRITALGIAQSFKREGKLKELERFIEEVEAECNECMESV